MLIAILGWLATGAGVGHAMRAEAPAAEVPDRLRAALTTQAATRARLRVLDGASCAQARGVAYRRSDAERDVVDQWYLASQLWADAVLLAAASDQGLVAFGPGALPSGGLRMPAGWNEIEARCHLDKGFAFLDRFWDARAGGYHPRSDPRGVGATHGPRYADDNAVAGLALLAAADAVTEPLARQRYLDAARREADFLAASGLWDETFGGGFWWNTNRGDTEEGKPAQTNALAALFFARLYEQSRVDAHRDWALRTLLWLDAYLYDPTRQLYRWSMRYQDPSRRTGIMRSERFFNYDQGIAIEAHLHAARLDGDPDRLDRARGIGRAIHDAFWGRERGGYNLEAGIEQVYTSYAAWTSLGHLALYDTDGDPRWLDLARANADALGVALREPDGGYAYRHYRCVDSRAAGCAPSRPTWAVDHTRDTAAQAWMQHLQVALVQRLAAPDQPR
jgi:uncharacterized protein YyaL (SSP411 family)